MEHRQAIETAKQTVNGTATEPEKKRAKREPKELTPIEEAAKAQRELANIDKREAEVLANTKARYEAERAELLAGISEKAMRILDAAREA